MSTVFCENREEKMAWCVLTNVQIHVFCVYIFSSTNIKEILHIMHLPFVSELASTAYSDAQVKKVSCYVSCPPCLSLGMVFLVQRKYNELLI